MCLLLKDETTAAISGIIGKHNRQWSNKVLKAYLLRGYAVNQRFETLENKIDKKFAEQDAKIEHLNKQVDFFVRTSLSPVEGVFHNGQIFNASLKDLGKKLFAFSKLNIPPSAIL